MRIAMIGTRGVPARYGGFETAVEEIGGRLVKSGHHVVVYCRGNGKNPSYLGMERVRLPALKHPVLETLSHTALSVGHLLRHRADVAIIFNAANAPLLPLVRAASIPVAVHVDGLEWQRAKWGPNGKRYYLAMERLAVQLADELIADAVGIQKYYRTRYNARSVFIPYGAPITLNAPLHRLDELGLSPDNYHLVVARMEPENHVDVIIEGFRRSSARKPLVVVGSVPYPNNYQKRVRGLAAADSRINLLGSIWDQQLLDALYAGSTSYLHGHSVGGTNPSLLRAMGAGASVIAWDVSFNREVLADAGQFFANDRQLATQIEDIEARPADLFERRQKVISRAATNYRWDDVASDYERLCIALKKDTDCRRKRVVHRSRNVPRLPENRIGQPTD